MKRVLVPCLSCVLRMALVVLLAGATPAIDSFIQSAGLPISQLSAIAFADDDDGDDGGGGGGAGGGGGGAGGGGGGAGGGGGGGGGGSERGGGERVGGPSGGRVIRLFDWLNPRPATVRRPARREAPPARPRSREIVAVGLPNAVIEALRLERYVVLAERRLGLVPGTAVRLRPPPRRSMAAAIARIRTLAPGAAVDENHRYGQTYRVQADRRAAGQAFAAPLAALAWPNPETCRAMGPIGIVDTAVSDAHPGLAGKRIERLTSRSSDRRPSSDRHGTAVATLLLGDGDFAGAAPQAQLVAVDAFHRAGGSDQADTFDLVAALDLLSERGISIVNLSLAGPADEVLDRVGRDAQGRGMFIVSAVGNDGPGSRPLFPAAYPWAIAVTAVDGENAVYSRANRGPHVDFAAPGVRIALIDARGRRSVYSGTSFAAPFVAAAIALKFPNGLSESQENRSTSQPDILPALQSVSLDLGQPGDDEIFGKGLPQLSGYCGTAP